MNSNREIGKTLEKNPKKTVRIFHVVRGFLLLKNQLLMQVHEKYKILMSKSAVSRKHLLRGGEF
jgi:hypothetical protein